MLIRCLNRCYFNVKGFIQGDDKDSCFHRTPFNMIIVFFFAILTSEFDFYSKRQEHFPLKINLGVGGQFFFIDHYELEIFCNDSIHGRVG